MVRTTIGAASGDPLGMAGRALRPEMESIIQALGLFQTAHAQDLPGPARQALEAFMTEVVPKMYLSNEVVIASQSVQFAVFRGRFEYLISEPEHESRIITERAFEHLRRSIVVDHDIRAKWAAASDERRCEQLGAVHLLSHGIWAFKAREAGAETDLVFGDPLDKHVDEVQRTARALVLTEWKMITTVAEVDSKAAEARKQLAIYTAGLLADLVVLSTRYVVLIAPKAFTPPKDYPAAEVTYRHIVIATDPDNASVEARRAS